MSWTDQEHDELMEIVDALCTALARSQILDGPVRNLLTSIASRSERLRDKTLGTENNDG